MPVTRSKAIDTFDRDIGKPLPPLSTPGLTARERDIVKLAATLRQRDLAEMLGCSTGAGVEGQRSTTRFARLTLT